jgi:hypothetical protein
MRESSGRALMDVLGSPLRRLMRHLLGMPGALHARSTCDHPAGARGRLDREGVALLE